MTALDFLAAVQQRADAATPQLWDATASKRMVAALTAALDLHVKCASYGLDLCVACRTIWPCDTVAAITDALTPKENDS